MWGQEGQAERTEVAVQQVGRTGQRCSPQAPQPPGEGSTPLQAIPLTRLHCRALGRNKNAQPNKYDLHVKMQRKKCRYTFPSVNRIPLWFPRSGRCVDWNTVKQFGPRIALPPSPGAAPENQYVFTPPAHSGRAHIHSGGEGGRLHRPWKK